MKIALIGYGKMGHAIERQAIARGHEIVCRIDVDNRAEMASEAFASADVAIEFTTPSTAFDNISKTLDAGVPVVSGTTAWTARLPELRQRIEREGGSLLWSSNFSIGVNLFMALNRYLTQLMTPFPQYTPSMHEVHHIHKLDHPSGTAITLAENIIANASGTITTWTEESPAPAGSLPITHERRGEVPGIHSVTWDSPVDSITVTHDARSRDGFALGAVMAAEWLASHPGFHTIDEMMNDLINKR